MIFPLKGNERIKESLGSIIESGRFPHAIIIEGDIGTGKRTLARFIAKTAVCEKSSSCGNCRSCRLADAGTHPDIETVSLYDGKKSIVNEQVEALRTTAHHSAHTADRRVFIIEDADTMNARSQNSLLKVLEDPPSDVIFILIATANEKLLETVVSRCVVFSLYPPSFEDALKVLTGEFSVDDDAAKKALTLSKNNIGKALVSLKKKNTNAGIDAAHNYFDLLEKGSVLDALLVTAKLEKNRAETTKFTMALKEFIVKKTIESNGLPETSKELTRMFDVVCEMEPLLETNINLGLFFTALTSKLMAQKN